MLICTLYITVEMHGIKFNTRDSLKHVYNSFAHKVSAYKMYLQHMFC